MNFVFFLSALGQGEGSNKIHLNAQVLMILKVDKRQSLFIYTKIHHCCVFRRDKVLPCFGCPTRNGEIK
jgi:hypothetical protein